MELSSTDKNFFESNLTSNQIYSSKASIQPDGEGQIEVNGKSYKGSIEIIPDRNGTLTVINELPLEDYVMGVLAGEIPRNWPIEVLKAQAITARTFAVLKQSEARKRGDTYDLENNSLYQMYQGSQLVNENIRNAVMGSQGDIATYNSVPIMAFFHSNCGGRTSEAVNLEPKSSIFKIGRLPFWG